MPHSIAAHGRDRRRPARRHQPGPVDGPLPHRRAPRERNAPSAVSPPIDTGRSHRRALLVARARQTRSGTPSIPTVPRWIGMGECGDPTRRASEPSGRCEREPRGRLVLAVISGRSCPAENGGPAPSITIARVDSCADAARSAEVISFISSSDNALRFSGRLRTTRAAAPSALTSTFRSPVPGRTLAAETLLRRRRRHKDQRFDTRVSVH